jgi:hypothetical protein
MSSLTTIEKSYGITLRKNENGNTYKYLKKGNIQQNVCFIINCLTTVNKNKELYYDDFLSKGKM